MGLSNGLGSVRSLKLASPVGVGRMKNAFHWSKIPGAPQRDSTACPDFGLGCSLALEKLVMACDVVLWIKSWFRDIVAFSLPLGYMRFGWIEFIVVGGLLIRWVYRGNGLPTETSVAEAETGPWGCPRETPSWRPAMAVRGHGRAVLFAHPWATRAVTPIKTGQERSGPCGGGNGTRPIWMVDS